MTSQRADRCPFPKPFAEDFRDCPAYQPVHYVPLDIFNQPLRPVWSCGHLDIGNDTDTGRPYTRCRLGDAEARLRWVDSIRQDRLQLWRRVAREFSDALAPRIHAMYQSKARQIAALGAGGDALAEASMDLRAEADAFIAQDLALLDARSMELEAIGFPTAGMKAVTGAAIQAM